MNKIPVFYDGDMGSDDLWAIALLLANPEQFEILGISTCFGNVTAQTATKNVLNLLDWLGQNAIQTIPVVQGATKPCDGVQLMADDAYGTDGVGGVIIPESGQKAEHIDLSDWYKIQLDAHPGAKIFCTGPATNLANFILKYPEKSQNIGEIIYMGGALTPPGADCAPVLIENGRHRKGNITEYAEFNAYCDPRALNILLQSGVRLTILSADATQHMVLSPARQTTITALPAPYGPAFHRMLMAALPLDQGKFGVDGPFLHDPNVITYALRPDLYRGITIPALQFLERPPQDPHRGETKETGGTSSTSAHWVNQVTDPDSVFEVMRQSLARIIERAQASHPNV